MNALKNYPAASTTPRPADEREVVLYNSFTGERLHAVYHANYDIVSFVGGSEFFQNLGDRKISFLDIQNSL